MSMQLPPPVGAAVDGGGRKKRAGLPKLLHKFFFKVLRLRPAAAGAGAAAAAEAGAAAFEAYYGYRMVDEYYYYSYGGVGSSASWAGVLHSIPEEDEAGCAPPDAAATLRKAHSDSEQFVAADAAAAVVEIQVVL